MLQFPALEASCELHDPELLQELCPGQHDVCSNVHLFSCLFKEVLVDDVELALVQGVRDLLLWQQSKLNEWRRAGRALRCQCLRGPQREDGRSPPCLNHNRGAERLIPRSYGDW